jgi:hypothetical protein
MTKKFLFVLAVLCLASSAFAQTQPSQQTFTVTTVSKDSTPIATTGAHSITFQVKLGTVAGSYSTCTAQAKTTIDGGASPIWLTIGSPASLTVTTGTNNAFTIVEPLAATVSATAANGFGRLSKVTIDCGAFGTTAPVTLDQVVSYAPAGSAGAATEPTLSSIGADLTALRTEVAAIRTQVENPAPIFVTPTPLATGGWDSFNATAADGATACTSTAQSVKASQGAVGGYWINNPNTADSWLHFYNSAAPTVGTTNPKLSFRIPGTASNSVAANLEVSLGVQFDTAISIACTSAAGTAGAPSVALEVIAFYK